MLKRWYDIERDMAAMNDMRRRLESFFGDVESRPSTRLSGSWPRANLFDTGAALYAVLEVPGVNSDDIEIEAHQDALTISGVRKTQAPEGYRVHRNERRPGKFSRSFGLPCKVDLEKTKAVLKNGLLTVTLEKAAEAQPKKITVTGS
jgi:HSP20 family protein